MLSLFRPASYDVLITSLPWNYFHSTAILSCTTGIRTGILSPLISTLKLLVLEERRFVRELYYRLTRVGYQEHYKAPPSVLCLTLSIFIDFAPAFQTLLRLTYDEATILEQLASLRFVTCSHYLCLAYNRAKCESTSSSFRLGSSGPVPSQLWSLDCKCHPRDAGS